MIANTSGATFPVAFWRAVRLRRESR